MTAPAAPPVSPGPATSVLPASLLAEAGRPVRFRHPRTGAELRFVPITPDEAGGNDSDEFLTYKERRRIQIEVDGGEITELEALWRAIAFNESEAAAGRHGKTLGQFWADFDQEFPRPNGDAAR